MKFVCFCCISAMNIFISLAKWEVVLFQRWIFFLARWQIRLCMSDEFIQRWIVHSEVTSCFISAVNFFPSEVTCISDEFIQRWIYVRSELTSCFASAVNFFFLARWQIRLCISDEFLQRWIYFHSELLTLEHIGRLVSSFICINEMKCNLRQQVLS